MKRICVFCGSSPGSRAQYRAATEELGTELARRNIGLVYGGGNVGLMGVLADAVLKAGGEVVGVISEHLMAREVGHTGLTRLHVVHSMHERKALMADLSDAFVALPGGFGTLEEFCEVLTWAQLGLHAKPCGVLNAFGYYSRLSPCVPQTRPTISAQVRAGLPLPTRRTVNLCTEIYSHRDTGCCKPGS